MQLNWSASRPRLSEGCYAKSFLPRAFEVSKSTVDRRATIVDPRSTILTACLFLADPNFASMKTAVARRKKKKGGRGGGQIKSRGGGEGRGGRLIHREEVLSICSRFSRAPTQFRCRCGQFNSGSGCSWNVLLSDYRIPRRGVTAETDFKPFPVPCSAVAPLGSHRVWSRRSIYKMALGFDCGAMSSVVSHVEAQTRCIERVL